MSARPSQGPRRPAGAIAGLLVASSVFAWGAAAGAAEPQAKAELAPSVIGPEETAVLVVEVATDGFGRVSFEPTFELENLEVVSGPSTTQSQSWVNGRTSSSLRLTWRLRPIAVGPAAVRTLRVQVGAQQLALPDQALEVAAQAPPRPRPPQDPFEALFGEDRMAPFRRPARAPAAEPKIRLRAEAEPRAVYAGEQVVWRLVLETQADISAFNPRSLPDFQGFWVREIPLPDRQRPEFVEIQGERFGRVAMLQRALFPLRSGRQTLDPVSADVVARVADATWFGPLGRDRQVALATDPMELEVRPLPAAPPDFSGVVGPVEVSAALDRTRVAAGQAATLSVAVRGFGNLQGLLPPELELPAGVRSFPPQPLSEEEVVGGRIRTTLSWRFVLVADRPGSYPLPAVRRVYFDPASGEYRAAESKALALEVTAGAAAHAPVPAPGAEPGDGADTGTPERGADGRARTILLALILALAVGLAVLAIRRRGRPARAARERLAAAIAAARREESPRQAAILLEEAWRAFAAERWGVPAGLPVAHWPGRLESAGVAQTRAAALVELFEELHYLRYAPELSSVETLRDEAVERSIRLRRELG